MANNGRKLSLALNTASEITGKVLDLRVLMAKMSERQRDFFSYMIKGYDELQTMLLAKRIGELAGVVSIVTTVSGEIIKTTSLQSLTDLERLNPQSLAALEKLAKDHIHASIGDLDYKEPLKDITWFFKMLAPHAAEIVTEIMDDKKVAAQTRLTAANSFLDRAGYAKKEAPKGELPVRIVLNMSSTPTVVEGTEVNP